MTDLMTYALQTRRRQLRNLSENRHILVRLQRKGFPIKTTVRPRAH